MGVPIGTKEWFRCEQSNAVASIAPSEGPYKLCREEFGNRALQRFTALSSNGSPLHNMRFTLSHPLEAKSTNPSSVDGVQCNVVTFAFSKRAPKYEMSFWRSGGAKATDAPAIKGQNISHTTLSQLQGIFGSSTSL